MSLFNTDKHSRMAGNEKEEDATKTAKLDCPTP